MITDLPQPDNPHGHSSVPPCTCPACLRATAQADQERARIADILRRLDEIEQLAGEVAGDE